MKLPTPAPALAALARLASFADPSAVAALVVRGSRSTSAGLLVRRQASALAALAFLLSTASPARPAALAPRPSYGSLAQPASRPFSASRSITALPARHADLRPISYDDAVVAAKREDKVLVLVFVGPAKRENAKLDPTWKDAKVRAWLDEKAIAIAVDAQKQPALAERHRIYRTPAVVIQSPHAVELDIHRGTLDAAAFLEFANAALSDQGTVERLRARLVGREDDPWARLDLASALLDQGRIKEALPEYLWCWDNGAQRDTSFAPARDGAVLDGWTKVARIHPDATEAAGERVRARCEALASPDVGEQALAEVIELVERFRLGALLVSTYDALGEEVPPREELRQRLAPHVVEVLFRERRWEDALAAVGDAEQELEARIAAARAERTSGQASGQTPAAQSSVLRFGADCYQAALATGRSPLAQHLADRLLEFELDAGTYSELIRRARRAGKAGLAVELFKKALASDLPPQAKRVLRDATDPFPRLK